MPFSKGHRPPREGSEVVLDPGDVEVGVVLFKELVEMLEKETESPVGTPEETPDVGLVELVGPIGTTDMEPEMVGADLGGPFVGTTSEVIAVDGTEVDDPPEGFEVKLELTAVALEEVEVLRGALELGAVEMIEITG